MASITGIEYEYYADEAENVLGVLILDATDRDWNLVVLGRDERSAFRAIDVEVSIGLRQEALQRLFKKIISHADSGQTVFPQGDVGKKKNAILEPKVPPERLHPHFLMLKSRFGVKALHLTLPSPKVQEAALDLRISTPLTALGKRGILRPSWFT